MAFRFSTRSENRLKGLHPDLVKVVRRALELTEVDFSVIEGMRTLSRQKKLVASGASKTLNSRHLTGHAIDIAPYIDGTIRWDWPPFYKLADAMKQAARELGVDLEWGGDWRSFKDGPHFQLSWARYPA
ncbi:MAG: M15 family metallopeptidase [Paracoccaceae bacterium]